MNNAACSFAGLKCLEFTSQSWIYLTLEALNRSDPRQSYLMVELYRGREGSFGSLRAVSNLMD